MAISINIPDRNVVKLFVVIMDKTKAKDRTDDRMNIDDGVVVGSQTVAYNNPVTVLFKGPRSFSKAHGVITDW